MKLSNLLYFVFVVLFLSSCVVGPKFSSPELEVPESFIYDSIKEDTVVNLEWWSIFEDDILDTLIYTALQGNRDVQIAASRILEAAYVVGYNRADIFPSIGYNGSAYRGNITPGGSVLSDVSNGFLGTGNVYWELDFWGKYIRATESAKASLLASEYGKRSIEISLISTVAVYYYQLLDFKARLKISKETLLSRKESTRIIGERFSKGIVAEIDFNQAQVQEAVAEAAVPYYSREVAKTENALSILLGEYPHRIVTDTLDNDKRPPEIPACIPSDLLQRRADLLQSEQLLKAQNAQIGVAQAMRFPSISLTGTVGFASSELSSLFTSDAFVWNMGAGLTGPIFNFGKNKRRVDIQKERTIQARLQYENSVLNAFREVEDALVGVKTVIKEVEAIEKQLTASQNAAKLARARYDGGVTSYLEVLDTERSLFEFEIKMTDAYQRMFISYINLYKALGGGWITREEKADSQAIAQ